MTNITLTDDHLIDERYRMFAYNVLGYELSLDDEGFLRNHTLNMTDTLDRYNSITIHDDVVRTHGNMEILTKQAVISIIEKLQSLLPEYDDHLKKIEELTNANFVKQLYLLKGNNDNPKPDPTFQEVGYIYVMKNMGYYKIGRCDLSKSRLGEYTRLPEEPDYIIMEKVKNPIRVENEIHKLFNNKRLRNGKCEWFELCDSDIKHIKEYLKTFSIE